MLFPKIARIILFLLSLVATANSMAAERVAINIGPQFIRTHDSFAVIEPVWLSVSIYDGPNKFKKDMDRFSREQQLVFACHWYMAEVNNGGHDQFYSNSTGIVWRDAAECFTEIRRPEIAKLIIESARRLGGTPSLVREERQIALNRLKPDFSDLDSAFYKLDSELDIEGALIAYIRREPRKFIFIGTVTK